jgi:replicative DNA helicase
MRNAKKGMPPLTANRVFRAVEEIRVKRQLNIRLLIIDYIQLIPTEIPSLSKTEQVNATIVEAKNLGLRLGVPVLACAQAGRQVDQRKFKIPQPGDAQHSSAIEQHCDCFMGVWRPHQTESPNSTITPPGYTKALPVTPSLCIIQMSKQRMEDGRYTWAVHFTPQELRLSELELSEEPLNF